VYLRLGKRLIDIAAGFFGIVILSPFFIALAVAVRIKLGSPIIFSQTRAGYKGKAFKLYKFRSMTNEKDAYGTLLPDSERLTAFGKTLRAWSLDELPQMWNILKGDISLVGVRPLHMEYLPLYNSEQMRRHDVKPGLTGNAQVNGRNAISWDDKFALDSWYVDNIGFWVDMKIIFKTFGVVLSRKGISDGQSETSTFFTGSNQRDD